jgi:hypothetical protein
MAEIKMLKNIRAGGKSSKQTDTKFIRTVLWILQMFFPLVAYMVAFYFGLNCESLQRSPLLHFTGAVTAFVTGGFTVILNFVWGFITGDFGLLQESWQLLFTTRLQLRIAMGLVFMSTVIIRSLNLMTKDTQHSSGIIPIFSAIGLFLTVLWLNSHQYLQLSVVEAVFIAVGYPVFYLFQKGRGFRIKRRILDDE